jgi:hypothetical protein
VAPHPYLEDISPAYLLRLGLRVAEPGEIVDVLVRQPRFPEAVFRGATIRDRIPVSDVLQCWLDVADHPARGEEMVTHFRAAIVPAAQQDPLGRDIRNSDNHSACSHIGQNGNAWATDVDGAGHE